jgi:hypothetical protein
MPEKTSSHSSFEYVVTQADVCSITEVVGELRCYYDPIDKGSAPLFDNVGGGQINEFFCSAISLVKAPLVLVTLHSWRWNPSIMLVV